MYDTGRRALRRGRARPADRADHGDHQRLEPALLSTTRLGPGHATSLSQHADERTPDDRSSTAEASRRSVPCTTAGPRTTRWSCPAPGTRQRPGLRRRRVPGARHAERGDRGVARVRGRRGRRPTRCSRRSPGSSAPWTSRSRRTSRAATGCRRRSWWSGCWTPARWAATWRTPTRQQAARRTRSGRRTGWRRSGRRRATACSSTPASTPSCGGGRPSPADAIARGRLYVAAGADCVYPILAPPELRRASPAPINVAFVPDGPSPRRTGRRGATRITFGPGLLKRSMATLRDVADRLRAS